VSDALVPVEQLSPAERCRLAELEQVVDAGMQTFVDVGLALLEIRDGRLYRQTHGTFESYCTARWGFTDRRGRQLIAAAEIGTMVPVANERQARELVPLLDRPDEVAAALRDADERARRAGRERTADDLREAVLARQRPAAAARRAAGIFDERIDAVVAALGERQRLAFDLYGMAERAARDSFSSGEIGEPPPEYWPLPDPCRPADTAEKRAWQRYELEQRRLRRAQSWARRVEWCIGRILTELDELGLRDDGGVVLDRSRVNVDAARARCTVDGRLPDGFDDAACVDAALGYAYTLLEPEPAT
jgi:hypothetical protein